MNEPVRRHAEPAVPGTAIMLAMLADSGSIQCELAIQWVGDGVVRPVFPRSAT
jgi:hypothetical protein